MEKQKFGDNSYHFDSVFCISTQNEREARELLAIAREKPLFADMVVGRPAQHLATADIRNRSKNTTRK
jgi:hypothetical protein